MPHLKQHVGDGLAFLGGADPKQIKLASVAERYSYMRYGAMALTSATFMTTATSYAMSIALDNVVGGTMLGMLLGGTILGIDNVILHAETRRDGADTIDRHNAGAAPPRPRSHGRASLVGRVAASCMLGAFVVSIGELGFYDKEIRGQIRKEHVAANAPLRSRIEAGYATDVRVARQSFARAEADRNALNDQVTQLNLPFDPGRFDRGAAQLDAEMAAVRQEAASLRADAAAARREQFAEVRGEIRSQLSTGRPGKGSSYLAAREEAQSADTRIAQLELDLGGLAARKLEIEKLRREEEGRATALAARQRPTLARDLTSADRRYESARARLAALTSDRETAIQRKMAADAAFVPLEDGLLTRADAYKTLLDRSPAARRLSLLAKLTVMLLEMMAVLVRLLARGPSHVGALMVLETEEGISNAVSRHVRATAANRRGVIGEQGSLAEAEAELERRKTEAEQARALRKFWQSPAA